jgi:hypothetical protein
MRSTDTVGAYLRRRADIGKTEGGAVNFLITAHLQRKVAMLYKMARPAADPVPAEEHEVSTPNNWQYGAGVIRHMALQDRADIARLFPDASRQETYYLRYARIHELGWRLARRCHSACWPTKTENKALSEAVGTGRAEGCAIADGLLCPAPADRAGCGGMLGI